MRTTIDILIICVIAVALFWVPAKMMLEDDDEQ